MCGTTAAQNSLVVLCDECIRRGDGWLPSGWGEDARTFVYLLFLGDGVLLLLLVVLFELRSN